MSDWMELVPGRGSERLFTTVARAYYAEKDVLGRRPQFELQEFGLAIGLDLKRINALRLAADQHVSAQRRAMISRPGKSANSKVAGWVLPTGQIVTIPTR